MALYVDKQRPASFADLDFHREQGAHLAQLARNRDMPHLLVHGPDGAGKKTRVNCLLRELYGPGADKIKVEQRELETATQAKFDITVLSSHHHIEINPSEAGLRDRFVIQNLLKELAQSHNVYRAGQRVHFKTVVVHEADRLTREAQQALRRTMEKYVASCRLVLICTNVSKLIDPIRSRCAPIRVAAPSSDDMLAILYDIAARESFELTPEIAEQIVAASDANLRKAILLLEATKVQGYPFVPGQSIVRLDWEQYLADTVQLLLDSQTPASLLEVRTRLYELLSHCIPAALILKGIALELNKKPAIGTALKQQIFHQAALYDHRLAKGAREIFHIEAFVASFMQLYKSQLIEMAFF